MLDPYRDDIAIMTDEQQPPPLLTWGYIETITSAGDHISRISGYVDGLEAVRQGLHHLFNTERYVEYQYYPDVVYRRVRYPLFPNYGVEFDQLIGKSFGYVEAVIEQLIADALTNLDYVVSHKVTSVTLERSDTVHVDLEVLSDYGSLTYGFNIPLSRGAA